MRILFPSPMQPPKRQFVHPLVGTVLLLASLLKIHAIVLRNEGLIAITFTAMAAGVELAIGSLLLFLPPNRSIVGLTATLFLGFAGYSTYLLTVGGPTCNCFGVLSTSIWHSLYIDTSCFVLLTASLRTGRFESWSISMHHKAIMTSISAVVLGLMLALLLGITDRIPAVARLRGEAVRLDVRSLQSVGASVARTQIVPIRMTNKWREPVTLVGGSFGCACNVTDDLPATLLPGESRDIRLVISAFRKPGRFRVPVHFFTDIQWQPELYGVLDLVVSGQPRQELGSTSLRENRDVSADNNSG